MTELLLGLLGAFILTEVHVCLPAFARWIVRRRVAKLPSGLRERMQEEWLAEVAASPSHIQKVVFAFGFFTGMADLIRAHGERKVPHGHGDVNITLTGVSATGSAGSVTPEPGGVQISEHPPTGVIAARIVAGVLADVQGGHIASTAQLFAPSITLGSRGTRCWHP